MSDVDSGDTQTALELFNDGAHLDTKLRVQVGQGLVHQQNAGLNDESTGQSNTLLLTAGEFVGLPVCQMGDLHQFQSLVNPAVHLRLGGFPGLQAVGNIFPDCQMGENSIVLEYHTDVTLVGSHIIDTLFAEIEVAAFDGVEACDHTQQGGFTAAGGTQQGKEFTFPDVQGNSVQSGKIAVTFHSVLDNDFIAHKDRPLYL